MRQVICSHVDHKLDYGWENDEAMDFDKEIIHLKIIFWKIKGFGE